jgi:parallel beta-helix repeat protein
MSYISTLCVVAALSAGSVFAQPNLPEITITADNTRIDSSCRVRVPEGLILADEDGNGVVHIVADGITVEFIDGESELIGVEKGTPWETITGVGVRIDGYKNVTLRNAHSHRYKVGIWASDADGLVIERADVSGGYAAKLESTTEAESGEDWLWPHDNDEHQWMDRYGAGIYVERSSGVTISECFARRRQNGIIIDRVTDSKVYDNDFSFLSGWGLAMWRASSNVVTRNAFDFCVRGYSHGVYNRGQDSAGILFFEQCSDNLIAENSATHGGDGFFGFAGKEALGQVPGPEGFSVERAGCNDNLIINNDFSYAAAHGIEMTFSFGNRLIGNRLIENAICGVWGGYSQNTLIAGNLFEKNGGMAYGLERGGVNIEHGAGNVVRDNVFRGDMCGVHLWWDDDEGLLATDWAKANHRGSTDNEIIRNRFEGLEIAVQLRECGETRMGGNEFDRVREKLALSGGAAPDEVMVTMELYQAPEYEALGNESPVGARENLEGRVNIVMGEYFPWDHTEAFARRVASNGPVHAYEVFGEIEDFYVVLNSRKAQFVLREPGENPDNRVPKCCPGGLLCTCIPGVDPDTGLPRCCGCDLYDRPEDDVITDALPYIVDVHGPAGVHPYVVKLRGKDFGAVYTDTLLVANWKATFFEWTVDPQEDLEGWRAQSESASARRVQLQELSLAYGSGGPREMELSDALSQAGPGADHFGMVATTKLVLPAGRWRVSTFSDDGVRVLVDGEPVLENWTWHGPTRDSGEFEVTDEHLVTLTVEHFEIDGHAVLEFELEPIEED